MYTIEDLVNNKICVEINGTTEADLLNRMFPFNQYEYVHRTPLRLTGWPKITIMYRSSELKNGEYPTEYCDRHYWESKYRYKVISVRELVKSKIKLKVKLPHYE
jgi:hypothetical protein